MRLDVNEADSGAAKKGLYKYDVYAAGSGLRILNWIAEANFSLVRSALQIADRRR